MLFLLPKTSFTNRDCQRHFVQVLAQTEMEFNTHRGSSLLQESTSIENSGNAGCQFLHVPLSRSPAHQEKVADVLDCEQHILKFSHHFCLLVSF